MYGYLVIYFATIICLQLYVTVDCRLHSDHNVECGIYPQIVTVDGGGLPYFVELNQCQGAVEGFDPAIKNCTFHSFKNVSVKITTHGGEKTVVLKNHTSCKGTCAKPCPTKWHNRDPLTCACKCNHAQIPNGHECPKDHAWDKNNCNCRCDLKRTPKKKVNLEECKLECKRVRECQSGWAFNKDDCRCYRTRAAASSSEGSDSSNQGKILAAVVLGEFFFLFFIFDFILYLKGTGFMYNVINKCKRNPRDKSTPHGEQARLNHEENDNNIPVGVRVDRNGASHAQQKVNPT
ncbi:uncharacterized protein LOC114523761 [Dendronephthya gigantea]|uniref:uncharacterized protein LOC114523761 n=1 Tax=Dendronephthya gigantea TaxID=151771 RepID=UPI00106C65A5|nr:uncharacterized protein LOC114523761 [Dendronephthya gigantea]